MDRIKIAARDSSLSQKQVGEIFDELKPFYPQIVFDVSLVKTTGDLDQKSSLLEKGNSDFFTKEIDQLVLDEICDVGVHSAKDLPQPLSQGLEIYALTKGLNSSDSLVLREGQTIESLEKGAKIGTSSLRRIRKMQTLREDFVAMDIRGTIDQRLELLKTGVVDGVIIAYAALIRLDLLHLNWIPLEGETAPWQGRLAVVGRKGREDLKQVFSSINCKKVLYLGTDPSNYSDFFSHVTHLPLVEIVPRNFQDFKIKQQFQDFLEYTHVLFTSKNAVHVFMQALKWYGYDNTLLYQKEILVIGEVTAKALTSYGITKYKQALLSTQEGMIDLLDNLPCEEGYFFYPRSSRARPLLSNYFRLRKLRHQVCDLYDSVDKKFLHIPSLEEFDEVVFTSPSTVEAFFSIFLDLPAHLQMKTIGPITQSCLETYILI